MSADELTISARSISGNVQARFACCGNISANACRAAMACVSNCGSKISSFISCLGC